jgi:hypothetical protein
MVSVEELESAGSQFIKKRIRVGERCGCGCVTLTNTELFTDLNVKRLRCN